MDSAPGRTAILILSHRRERRASGQAWVGTSTSPSGRRPVRRGRARWSVRPRGHGDDSGPERQPKVAGLSSTSSNAKARPLHGQNEKRKVRIGFQTFQTPPHLPYPPARTHTVVLFHEEGEHGNSVATVGPLPLSVLKHSREILIHWILL